MDGEQAEEGGTVRDGLGEGEWVAVEREKEKSAGSIVPYRLDIMAVVDIVAAEGHLQLHHINLDQAIQLQVFKVATSFQVTKTPLPVNPGIMFQLDEHQNAIKLHKRS